jgi:hypothetical protein
MCLTTKEKARKTLSQVVIHKHAVKNVVDVRDFFDEIVSSDLFWVENITGEGSYLEISRHKIFTQAKRDSVQLYSLQGMTIFKPQSKLI